MSVGEMLQATLGSRNILRVRVSWPPEDHGRGGETWLTASRRSCTSRDCTTWPSNLAGASQLNCAAASPRESFLRYGRSLSMRSEEHTSELQSHVNLVCRLLLEKKKSRSQ